MILPVLLAQAPLAFPGGLAVWLVERHESPLLRAELLLPLPATRPGLPELLRRTLLASPAGRRSPEAFAAAQEDAGIRMDLRLEPEGLRLTLLARSRDQELAFALLADRLLRSFPDPAAFEASRQRYLQDLSRLGADDLALARLRSEGMASAPPTEAELSALAFEDLLAFKAKVLQPRSARLALAGDLTPSQARQLVWLSLGTWRGGAAPPPRLDPAWSLRRILLPSGRSAVRLARPAPGLRPLLDLLLREILPGLQGTGRPGNPWLLLGEAPQVEAQLQALKTRTLTEADLHRARQACQAARPAEALDPDAELRERVEEETGEVGVEGLRQGWAAITTE